MKTTTAPRWWELYANIVKLTDWMVDNSAYVKADLAAAVEKPWYYDAEAREAGIFTGEEES